MSVKESVYTVGAKSECVCVILQLRGDGYVKAETTRRRISECVSPLVIYMLHINF